MGGFSALKASRSPLRPARPLELLGARAGLQRVALVGERAAINEEPRRGHGVAQLREAKHGRKPTEREPEPIWLRRYSKQTHIVYCEAVVTARCTMRSSPP